MSRTLQELRKYTGWFECSNNQRLVVTVDFERLKFGYLNPVTGAIINSANLSMSVADVPQIRVGKLQTMAIATPGSDMVSFDIKDEEVSGLKVGNKSYERTEHAFCHLKKLPLELRQMIWRYTLTTANKEVALCRSKTTLFMSSDLTKKLNRINETCKDFRNDARFLELAVNDLLVVYKEGPDLLQLLNRSHVYLKRFQRRVEYGSSGGPTSNPTKEILHGLLRYAKATENINIDIIVWNWNLEGQSPLLMREFVLFGFGLRRAIRGIEFGRRACTNSIVSAWRMNEPLSKMNVPQVKLWPRKEVLNDSLWKKVRCACNVKAFGEVRRCYNVDTDVALDSIIADIKGWYKNGIRLTMHARARGVHQHNLSRT
ncbi:hypothetical protein BKA66DRAFT_565702 [Pyrenochaeta sp. MPI-SDFR-AT-0127]|nr:hypothetical protein BKA66DRAFT_565702 [Pyrenochaeta sp. MPI-SDFR-AT-0127]